MMLTMIMIVVIAILIIIRIKRSVKKYKHTGRKKQCITLCKIAEI